MNLFLVFKHYYIVVFKDLFWNKRESIYSHTQTQNFKITQSSQQRGKSPVERLLTHYTHWLLSLHVHRSSNSQLIYVSTACFSATNKPNIMRLSFWNYWKKVASCLSPNTRSNCVILESLLKVILLYLLLSVRPCFNLLKFNQNMIDDQTCR